MASHSRSQMSLLLWHDLWLASLTGPPSTILPLQKSLLNTILSHSLPSPLYEKASTTLFTNIALLYAFNGSLALASTNFEEAIARSTYCAIAHFGLGLTRFLESHDADAIQAWQKCIDSFERTAPESIQAGEWMGTNKILYQMWRPGQYGENQWGGSHQDDLDHEGESIKHRHGWILAKDDVLWNLSVAQRRCEKHRSDKNADLKKDREMLFVKGIPAGMLFCPPLELRQEVFVPSKEVNGRCLRGPMKKTDIGSAEAHTDDNGISPRSVSPSLVLQVDPISIKDRDPSKADNHQPRPGVSSLTLKISNEDCGYLSVYHKRGQSSPAIFQGGPKAAWSENRDEVSANAFAYQPAVTSTVGNSQPNETSSHINRYHNGYRTLDDLATFNTLEKRKLLPLIPGRQKDISYQDSQYALALQPSSPSPPPPPPPMLTHSRALSAKASSLARFFTKAKRARGGKGTHSRTGSDADGGIDVDSRPDAGVDVSESDHSSSRTSSHPTSRGFVANRANTPISDDNRGKGTPSVPGRPAPPTQGLSAQGFQEGHPLNLAFVKADTQPRYIGVGLASKVEWEKNMEPKADDEVKPPKPLFFPREEINRKPEGKSGIGLGLGKVNTMPILPSQNQNQNQPAPLSIPHTAPFASNNFAKGSVGDDSISSSSISKERCRRVLIFNDQSDTGIDAAYSLTRGTAKPRTRTTPYLNLDFNHHPPGPAVSASVPAFPQRTSSLSPVGLSSSAPSCPLPQPPPPPPQQQPPPQQRQQYQRRGRPLSQLGHELEWDDEKGDFVIRNEEKGKGKWNKKRDESTSSSIQMRRARDRSKRRRQKETNEGNTTAVIPTSTKTTNTPLESTNGHTSIKIPGHTHNNSITAATINLKEQNTHQSITYAYPTLTSIPSSQAFCFGHDLNCANNDEEKQEEETDDISERSTDIIKKIEDLECGIQSDEGCLTQTPTAGEGFAPAKCGNEQKPEEGGEDYAEDGEEEAEEEEEDGEEETEEAEEEKKGVEEVVEAMGLLSSATFQGFGRGMAGQWYDGKWH